MPRERLTIDDFSDREFLLVLEDCGREDPDGWAESDAVAERLDLAERRIASSRLSWLRRWGAVEREHARDVAGNLTWHRDGKPKHTQRWRLTEPGRMLAHGELRAREQQSLDRLDGSKMLAITRWLAERATNADAVSSKLVSREWRYGTRAGR